MPTARLDIYGSGSQMPTLREIAARHGVAEQVTLHGHDPRARDALWRSSAFLMTSLFEGYPLSTLESLSHGCPVISYDIKYGPREQITDGVDGFLVPNRDIDAMADRIVTMLTSPELVEKMSEAALEKARQHGHTRFLDEWRQVLEKAVELKPLRTRLEHVRLDVHRISVTGRKAGGKRSAFVPRRVDRGSSVRLKGTLHVRGHSRMATLDSVQLSLDAVHFPTGMCVPLPLSVSHRGEEFRLSSSFALSDVFGDADELDGVRLRLRLVWQNSTWDTFLSRPHDRASGVELTYPADVLELSVR